MPTPTHEVTNQPPPLVGWNLFDADPVLPEALAREGGGWAAEQARAAGALVWSDRTATVDEVRRASDPALRGSLHVLPRAS
jgi:putative acyl-CoA dehydrogenase